MTNAQKTVKFLAAIDAKIQDAILGNIAKHYSIANDEAYAEVTGEEAEHLLDYMTGPERVAVSMMMRRYGLQ